MPVGCQSDVEVNWGLVLYRAHAPVPLNGSLSPLKRRTTVWSFWHAWGRETDVEIDWVLLGLLRVNGPVSLNGPLIPPPPPRGRMWEHGYIFCHLPLGLGRETSWPLGLSGYRTRDGLQDWNPKRLPQAASLCTDAIVEGDPH